MINIEEIKAFKIQEVESFKRRIQTLRICKELYLDSGEFRFSVFGNIAISDAFLGNIIDSKKEYCKSGLIALEFYKIYNENRYPNLIKYRIPVFRYMGAMFDTIISDNVSLLNEFGRTIVAIEDSIERNRVVNYNLTYSLKYLLLKDFGKSKEYLKEVHSEKYFQLHFKGFSHIVKGILENNIDLINEGLAYRIKYHKRENPKDSLFYAYSIEATALAKLARLYGFEPDVSSPFIHKGLLEKTEGIVYEGIEEITDALEEANQRAGGLGAKISSWFQ